MGWELKGSRQLVRFGLLVGIGVWLAILSLPAASTQLDGWWRPAVEDESIDQVAIDDPRWQAFDPDILTRFIAPDVAPDARRSWLLLRPAAGELWPADEPVLRVGQGGLQWLSVALPGEPLRRGRLLNPLATGEVAHGVTAWPLRPLAGTREPLLLGLDSRSVLQGSLRFEAMEVDEHRRRDARWLAFASAMLGVMLSMGLMALVFAVYLRDTTFLHYAGYNVSYAGILTLQTGFAAAPLGLVFAEHGAPISGRVLTAASVCFAVLFLDRFADLKRYAPRWRWVLVALGSGIIIATTASLLPWPALADVGRSLTNPLLIFGGPAVVMAAIAASWRGSRYARIFLIGWLPLLAVTVCGSLQLFGLFRGWHWLSTAALGAGALEALVLSLGLARRSLDLRRERDAVRALADLDPLTGLLNRRAWVRRVEALRATTDAGPLSLLFIDVDYFKDINDRHGHETGDHVLTRLAAQLRAELRQQDVLARHGGEELVAALPECPSWRAHRIAERLRGQVAGIDFATTAEPGHQPLRLTVSVGVASLRPNETIEALIARADQAMYRAKAAGRNRVELIE